MNSRYRFIPDLSAEIPGDLPGVARLPNIPGHAVYADACMKVLLLPFRAGQILAEHRTPHDAIMHVLRGRGRITLGADQLEVRAGSWMRMTGGLPHSIRAETDLLLLLQVLVQTGEIPRIAETAA
jgi:quercetin dioxygenase-like cupin family protein